MNAKQFRQAVKMVDDRVDLSDVSDNQLDGCGLPEFQPVLTSIKVVAKHIAWQAMQLNGQWDFKALDECRNIARRKFIIVSEK